MYVNKLFLLSFFALELGIHTINLIDLSLGIGSQDTPYFKVHIDTGWRINSAISQGLLAGCRPCYQQLKGPALKRLLHSFVAERLRRFPILITVMESGSQESLKALCG